MNLEQSINEKQFAYWPVKALKVKIIKGLNEVRYGWIWRKHYFINGETEVWIKGKIRYFETVNILADGLSLDYDSEPIIEAEGDIKAIH